jgi:hypothetical protein
MDAIAVSPLGARPLLLGVVEYGRRAVRQRRQPDIPGMVTAAHRPSAAAPAYASRTLASSCVAPHASSHEGAPPSSARSISSKPARLQSEPPPPPPAPCCGGGAHDGMKPSRRAGRAEMTRPADVQPRDSRRRRPEFRPDLRHQRIERPPREDGGAGREAEGEDHAARGIGRGGHGDAMCA